MNSVVTNTVTNTRMNLVPSHSRLPKIHSALHGALAVALFFALLLCAARPAQAQYETLLYNFPEGPYGEVQGPQAPLTPDGAGNFYGTTVGYGSSDNGSVFEVLPNGSYYEATVFSFPGGAGGSYPGYSPVVFDKLGNLYGTTAFGGANNCGLVYELTPTGTNWTETVLYSFPPSPQSGTDNNCTPLYGVIIDQAGNLYGTTSYGRISNGQQGNGQGGAVFELSKSGGDWTETLLYTFPYGALSGLTTDAAGNLYGVGANASDYPFAFQVSPNGKGQWNASLLYTFLAYDNPTAAPVPSAAGDLYGTTATGGAKNSGTVYQLSPITTGKKEGQWKYKTLYTFNGQSKGPDNPFGAVALDASGNIYGVSQYGGKYRYYGTLWELSPKVGKTGYTEKLLNSFNGEDGNDPMAGVTLYDGNLYGTTYQGGAYSAGTAYEVTP
jgi:uncharacterized repeat protein (TIGR03803 family)